MEEKTIYYINKEKIMKNKNKTYEKNINIFFKE